MDVIEKLEENQLELEAFRESGAVRVSWRGKSNDRDPGRYLGPFFERMIEAAAADEGPLELDFTSLSYMNSSTITPIVQLLERIREREMRCSLFYDRTRAWQRVSFTAMRIFASDKIQIVPIEPGTRV